MTHPINPNHKAYYKKLEEIREIGATNMWGAAPYLYDAFPELSRAQATEITLTWIENYDELLKQGYFTRNELGD